MVTHSIILAWRIPWPEELVGYSPQGHKESDMTARRLNLTELSVCNKDSAPIPWPMAHIFLISGPVAH